MLNTGVLYHFAIVNNPNQLVLPRVAERAQKVRATNTQVRLFSTRVYPVTGTNEGQLMHIFMNNIPFGFSTKLLTKIICLNTIIHDDSGSDGNLAKSVPAALTSLPT